MFGPRPLGIAIATPEMTAEERRLASWISRPSGFMESLAEYDGAPVVYDEFQESILDAREKFVIALKPRQVGISFAFASRALAKCYIEGPGAYTGVFVSYNLEDAREKMRYVDLLDGSFPASERMRRITDNALTVEFENHNRIIASFKPLGKGNAELFVDEMAHMLEARALYQAAVPITTRGRGSVVIGSTPMAKSGMFHDIWTRAEGKFRDFRHIEVKWWDSAALCRDVAAAREARADLLETPERVERFGSPALASIFANMYLEDFRTEYECEWADEATAFLKYELIEACSPTGADAVVRVENLDDLRGSKEELYVGVDIGRRNNATEIRLGAYVPERKRLEERWTATLPDTPFDEQEALLDRILGISAVRRLLIDQNGLGMQLAESLARRWGSRVVPVEITPTSKPRIATNMRMMMEKGMYAFYPDREMRAQLHSIKRVVTAHGNVVYDVARNEKHHADKAWAAALELFACSSKLSAGKPSVVVLDARPDTPRREALGFFDHRRHAL